MCIAEERNPVRAHVDAEADRFQQRGDSLVRQAVDQIEVDARHPCPAQFFDRMAHHFGWLDAINGFLNLRIEFLHAETGAGEAQLSDPPDHFIRERARIALDGKFGVSGDVEIVPDALHRALQIIRHQRRRCPPTPMQMRNRHAVRQLFGQKTDFLVERLRVLRDRRIFSGQLHVAPAIPAKLAAIGNVQIERYGFLWRERGEPVGVIRWPYRLGEVRGSRITRVARYIAAHVGFQRVRH